MTKYLQVIRLIDDKEKLMVRIATQTVCICLEAVYAKNNRGIL